MKSTLCLLALLALAMSKFSSKKKAHLSKSKHHKSRETPKVLPLV